MNTHTSLMGANVVALAVNPKISGYGFPYGTDASRTDFDAILQEDGFFLLQETDDYILLESA